MAVGKAAAVAVAADSRHVRAGFKPALTTIEEIMQILDVVKKASKVTDSVIVGFSGGKDSIVTLDLCARYFKRIEAYFLYLVQGLEFQERYIRYCEKRYGVSIHRLPHWQLGDMLRQGVYRPHNRQAVQCKRLTIKDIKQEMRSLTGVEWIATGQKAIDSVERNAMIRNCGGVDEKNKSIYPIAFFNDKAVYSYLKINRIPLPPDYGLFGRSFGRLHYAELKGIKDRYPDDYMKILEVFPYVEAVIKREEFRKDHPSPQPSPHEGRGSICVEIPEV